MSLVSYKVDFHTHSILSQDGGIREIDYKNAVVQNKLDYIAITDHNEIDYAILLQKKLGEVIIVGEEIITNSGEIIGLFLTKRVPPNLTLQETIIQIKKQHGIVYVPHPFDTQRFGIGEKNLREIQQDVDIIETFNGRMVIAEANIKAENFSQKNNIIGVCSSDAHSANGLGYAYTVVGKKIDKTTLIPSLKNASYNKKYLPPLAYFAPMYNRIRHYVFG